MSINQVEVTQLINWTKQYLEKAVPKSKIKAVVGLSGGIDSAVTAAICTKAVGVEGVIGVVLPCESPLEDGMDAVELAQELGIFATDADLEQSFRSIWDMYRFSIGWPGQQNKIFPPINKMVKANAKARLRMVMLYMVANHVGGLVVGTTNKSEAAIGYATKYGDGGVDIEPLMDFYKTEIWEMGNILNIPQKIIDRVPTAGLWDGQTDMGELGLASYSELDQILEYLIDNKTIIDLDSVKVEKIRRLIEVNMHKDLNLPHFVRER